MEVRAVAKYVRVQPRKVRIIADEIRGKSAQHASSLLRYHTSKGARMLRKVLVSAMANAQENENISPESLVVARIQVDEGPRLKRMTAKAMGRGARIIKKTSHITVIVEDVEAAPVVKHTGTKPKPRPTFNTGKGKKTATKPAAAAPVADEVVEETTDTKVEEATAAETSVAEEATPVTAADAPEEGASTTDEAAEADDTKKENS